MRIVEKQMKSVNMETFLQIQQLQQSDIATSKLNEEVQESGPDFAMYRESLYKLVQRKKKRSNECRVQTNRDNVRQSPPRSKPNQTLSNNYETTDEPRALQILKRIQLELSLQKPKTKSL